MSSPLVRAADLAAVLAARLDAVTVLDVRYRMGGPPGSVEHAAGHIPGAAYVDLDTDLAAPPADPVDERGRHPLPEPAVFEAAMRRVGVRTDRPVVVYDDWGGRAAARAWWLLRWAGHRDVRVLDGGWPAWLAAGGQPERGPSDPEPGDFAVHGGQLTTLGSASGHTGVLVDARAPERFRGDVEPVDPVAGHVPGAVNVPTDTNLGADGLFRPADQLTALYAAAGVDRSRPVAVYCGSGVTACHDLLALEVAGIEGSLYPGSWSGWVSDPANPVATGLQAIGPDALS